MMLRLSQCRITFHNCENSGLDLFRTGLKFPGLNLATVWWGITDRSEEGVWRVDHSGEDVTGYNWMEGHPKMDTTSNCGMTSTIFYGSREADTLLDIIRHATHSISDQIVHTLNIKENIRGRYAPSF